MMLQFFSQLTLSLLTAVVTAFLAVQFGLRRFYTEHWWEEKFAAYSRIVEALHHIKVDFEREEDAMLSGREIPEDEKADFRARYKAAMAEIRKNIDVGEFLFADHAVRQLRKFLIDIERAGADANWVEYVDNSIQAVTEHLWEIKGIAREDLGIRKSTYKFQRLPRLWRAKEKR